MSICLQTQILFFLKVSKRNHQNIPDQPSIRQIFEHNLSFFEDSSGKLFLNFATQVYKWIPGYFFQCHAGSSEQNEMVWPIRCLILITARNSLTIFPVLLLTALWQKTRLEKQVFFLLGLHNPFRTEQTVLTTFALAVDGKRALLPKK